MRYTQVLKYELEKMTRTLASCLSQCVVTTFGQRLSAEREHGNTEDCFAIAGGEG